MWPFEGKHKADVAPREKEFDTPGLRGREIVKNQFM